ncbi:YdeI/OmpD-associated family protein [Hymenobacter tibetensis]|uniref:YdeI/OmpD-associated family protein n=1 Tax=Hymenobacter tibetensis TaxID=497967 RepID=UPI00293F4B3F|nr:YdeI/OmpD-associated family protein [Hymenobacter tibetensis]
MPYYTFQKKNVVLLHAFKTYCALNSFNGALLQDAHGLLVQQKENMQAVRQLRLTSVQEILAQEHLITACLDEAIAVEKSGLKVDYKKTEELALPQEFLAKLQTIPGLNTAFYALTPGRQRGYLLHFAEPKQTTTRLARVEKYLQHILLGKGLQDECSPYSLR